MNLESIFIKNKTSSQQNKKDIESDDSLLSSINQNFDVDKKLKNISNNSSELSTSVEFNKFVKNKEVSNAKICKKTSSNSFVNECIRSIDSNFKKCISVNSTSSSSDSSDCSDCESTYSSSSNTKSSSSSSSSSCTKNKSSNSKCTKSSTCDPSIFILILEFLTKLLIEILKIVIFLCNFFKDLFIYLFFKLIQIIKIFWKLLSTCCDNSCCNSISSSCKNKSSKSSKSLCKPLHKFVSSSSNKSIFTIDNGIKKSCSSSSSDSSNLSNLYNLYKKTIKSLGTNVLNLCSGSKSGSKSSSKSSSSSSSKHKFIKKIKPKQSCNLSISEELSKLKSKYRNKSQSIKCKSVPNRTLHKFNKPKSSSTSNTSKSSSSSRSIFLNRKQYDNWVNNKKSIGMIKQERYEKNTNDYYIKDNTKKNSKIQSKKQSKIQSKKNSKIQSKKNSKIQSDSTTSSLDSGCNPYLLNEIFKVTNHQV